MAVRRIGAIRTTLKEFKKLKIEELDEFAIQLANQWVNGNRKYVFLELSDMRGIFASYVAIRIYEYLGVGDNQSFMYNFKKHIENSK